MSDNEAEILRVMRQALEQSLPVDQREVYREQVRRNARMDAAIQHGAARLWLDSAPGVRRFLER